MTKTIFITHRGEAVIVPGDGDEALKKIYEILVENRMGYSGNYAGFADDAERGNLELHTVSRTLGWGTTEKARNLKTVVIENSWDKYSPATLIKGKVMPQQTAERHDECMSDPEVAAYASCMSIEEFRKIESPVISLMGYSDITEFTVEEHDNYFLIKPDWDKAL